MEHIYHLVMLRDSRYALAQQITTGRKTIVWKALRLPGSPERFQGEVVTDLDWLRQLQPTESPLRTGVELPAEWVEKGQWVAIKVPRELTENEEDVREEAQRLQRVAQVGQAKRARPIHVVDDLTQARELPILVLEWAPGRPLTEIRQPFGEREGLRLSIELIDFVRTVLSYRILLTDTLKPGSIFYDPATSSFVLLDWNTVGMRPEDAREVLLPILGQTLYYLFTGTLLEFSEKGRAFGISGKEIGADKVADSWDQLSLGTRSLVTEVLLGRVSGEKPHDILANLAKKVSEQWERVTQSATEFLAMARESVDPDRVLNYYDLVGRGILEGLTADDRSRYRDCLCEMLSDISPRDLECTWPILNWVRRCFPHDTKVRWLWLSYRAVEKDPTLWDCLQTIASQTTGLQSKERGPGSFAQRDGIEVRAIEMEARLRSEVQACESSPSLAAIQSLQNELDELDGFWKGTGLAQEYGTSWLLELQDRLKQCENRTQDIARIRRRIEEELQSGLPSAGALPVPHQTQLETSDTICVASLERWASVETNQDHEVLIVAAQALKDGDLVEAMDALYAPAYPTTADHLVRQVYETLFRSVQRQVKVRSREAVERRALDTARRLLTQLVKVERADNEAQAILGLLEYFEDAQREVDNQQPSEAYRIAYRKAPQWLEAQPLDTAARTKLNRWAREVFDLVLEHALNEASEEKRREAQEWLEDSRLGISKSLSGAAAVLDEVICLNPADVEAVRWRSAVRAFQTGREALLIAAEKFLSGTVTRPLPYETGRSAVDRLTEVQSCGWPRLEEAAAPYTALARAIEQVTSDERDDTDLVTQDIARYSALGQADINLEASAFEMWGDGARLTPVIQTYQRLLGERREASYKTLDASLQAWFGRIACADTAFDERQTYERWKRILTAMPHIGSGGAADRSYTPGEIGNTDAPDNVSVHTPQDSESEAIRALTESKAKLDSRFHSALAQAHLIRAGTHFADGRRDLAYWRLEQAEKSLKTAEASADPDDTSTNQGVEREVRALRRQIWERVVDRVAHNERLGGALSDVSADITALQRVDKLHASELPEDDCDLSAFLCDLALSRPMEPRSREKWLDEVVRFPAKMVDELLRQRSVVAELVERDGDESALAFYHYLVDTTPETESRSDESICHALAARGRRYGRELYNAWKDTGRRRCRYEKIVAPSDAIKELDRCCRSSEGTAGTSQKAKCAYQAWRNEDQDAFAEAFSEAAAEEWPRLAVEVLRQQKHDGLQRSLAAIVLLGMISLVGTFAIRGLPPEESSASPTATPAPAPPLPVGEATIDQVRLGVGGAEVRYEVVVTNTGEITAAFGLEVVPQGNVRWLDVNDAPSPPRFLLPPGENQALSMLIERMPPPHASLPETLLLQVQNQSEPLASLDIPVAQELEAEFELAPTEWVLSRDNEMDGIFMPSLDGPFWVACYDAEGSLVVAPEKLLGDETGVPFTCPLVSEKAGEWHISVFPGSEAWKPPAERPLDGFAHEAGFRVREPVCDVGVAEAAVHFDPDFQSVSVGSVYTLWNAGEVEDSFTVELGKVLTNVRTITVSTAATTGITPTSALTGTISVTNTTVLTPTGHAVSLLPLETHLEPCADPYSGKCELARVVLLIETEEPVTVDQPLDVVLLFRPNRGEGDPASVSIHLENVPDAVPPKWLLLPSFSSS